MKANQPEKAVRRLLCSPYFHVHDIFKTLCICLAFYVQAWTLLHVHCLNPRDCFILYVYLSILCPVVKQLLNLTCSESLTLNFYQKGRTLQKILQWIPCTTQEVLKARGRGHHTCSSRSIIATNMMIHVYFYSHVTHKDLHDH